jgi:hypothetical protein
VLLFGPNPKVKLDMGAEVDGNNSSGLIQKLDTYIFAALQAPLMSHH